MSGGGSISETTGNQGQIRSVLDAGLDAIDLNATVTFTQYRRLVLPADGFVFWVRADILSPSALANSSPVTTFTANQPPVVEQTAPTMTVKGSLHHTTVNRQDPDESFSVNRMVFTCDTAVDNLAAIDPQVMWLAETAGYRYAFSTRSMWYKQAGLYHYSGDAVYPTLASQIIDNPAQLAERDVVVSNSLPIWLTLNQFFPIYPSLLVPDNIVPPYASVHIGDDDTEPMQSGAFHDATGTRWQLAKDIVHVTTYGVRNNTIMDWLDAVNDYTLANPTTLGIMNSPIPRDGKRGQVEISAIAQKKVITFHASYYQSRVRQIARQFILDALIESFTTAL